ncbi:tyrosine-type recombinase/integrase [uncultured Sphingomonas sp.]|uniref:tyrosine-type recombinase/integrase n=1 Tax=uncultured Sphingomonas sp. TaxID=158754 RepID=UPI0035CA14EC
MLTNAAVRGARPKPAAYKISDGQGLVLHVTPLGCKSFRMRFRDAGGREQTLTIGQWPEVTLDQARAWRDQARAQLARGEDPRDRTCEISKSGNFEIAARDWHSHHAGAWSPVHAANVLDSLVRDVFPEIGTHPLDAVDQPAVLSLLEAVEARGAIETARRLRQRIGKVYSYARAKGWTTAANPADVGEALTKGVAGGRQPALVDVDELRGLVDTVAALDSAPILRLAARFLPLTAVRMGTLRAMRWGEAEDLNGCEPLWRVPAANMKLGVAEKGDAANDHVVPLSTAAAGVLRAARAIAGGAPAADALVFPGRRGGAIGEGAIGALYARTPYAGRHVPHGWRASFSTVMNLRRREDRAAIDMTLGHKPSGMSKVERAYNRADHLDLRREILEDWGALIAPGPVGSHTA